MLILFRLPPCTSPSQKSGEIGILCWIFLASEPPRDISLVSFMSVRPLSDFRMLPKSRTFNISIAQQSEEKSSPLPPQSLVFRPGVVYRAHPFPWIRKISGPGLISVLYFPLLSSPVPKNVASPGTFLCGEIHTQLARLCSCRVDEHSFACPLSLSLSFPLSLFSLSPSRPFSSGSTVSRVG